MIINKKMHKPFRIKRGKKAMNPHMIGLILVIFGGLILTIGDFSMKEWISTNRWGFFVLGLAIYVVGEVLMALSFRYQNIAVASILTVLFNVIALSLLSYLFFHEKLSGLAIVGIILGLISVAIMELSTF